MPPPTLDLALAAYGLRFPGSTKETRANRLYSYLGGMPTQRERRYIPGGGLVNFVT